MFDRSSSRRAFLKANAVAAMAAALPVARSAHAAGNDSIRIGVIGCGGRGRGAVVNALSTGKDVRLTAVADLFDFQAKESIEVLKRETPEQVDVPPDRCFVGFDAYKQLIDSGVDVVLIAAAVHFHPMLLSAAVDAGKHVFTEKAHAIDVPGVRQTIAACEKGTKNRRSIVSGLCWRYSPPVRETIRRVLDGAIGRIVAIEASYMVGARRAYARKPDMTEMQYQMWNWYNFHWLSGDQPGAQLIHCLDLASWGLGDRPPVKAWGMGGRQVHAQPEYGDLFDHSAAVFEYESGVRLFAYCRDQSSCYNEYSVTFVGTKGRACVPQRCHIQGDSSWSYKGPGGNMYDLEHVAFFDSIRKGQPINNGDYMATSSALAILARETCYTGQEITWEQLMKAQSTFALPRYGWNVSPPVLPDARGRYPAAMPGITVFH
jgi:predicted dehydrogenase